MLSGDGLGQEADGRGRVDVRLHERKSKEMSAIIYFSILETYLLHLHDIEIIDIKT